MVRALILSLLASFAGDAVRELVVVSSGAVNHHISSLCQLQEGFLAGFKHFDGEY